MNKVLIVDDVPQNIHLLTTMLRDEYLVIAATNGEKALELAKKVPKPDAILLDIIMPEMDGYTVCQKLKENPDTKDIPVLFISGIDDSVEKEKSKKFGGADFLVKPVSRVDLLAKLKNHIQSSQHSTDKNLADDNKSKILIVDDAPENLQVMIEILKNDYTVNVTTSATRAYEVLKNGFIPDLILLDVLMPEVDGFEVCKHLKSQPLYENIPIIFLTILENEADIVKGFELGAVDYVSKPFEPTVLKARVKTHLKLKHHQDLLANTLKEKDEVLVQQTKFATLGEMIGNIAHQWRQPLSLISTYVTGIGMKMELGINIKQEELLDGLNKVNDTAQFLSKTIDDFQDYLKPHTNLSDFNMKDVIEKNLEMFGKSFENNEIKIIMDFKNIIIHNSPNELLQVVINILNNAKDALKEFKQDDRLLFITISQEDNNAIISIKDNAGGIPQDILPKIFDAYFTTKEKSNGTGLGLYMSYQIITKRFNGSIEAINEEYAYEGVTYKGANFKVVIPIE